MEYNKRQFQKSNDKKVLHKVKKHWVVMSMALLMAIGGKAVSMQVSANADTTNNDNGKASNTDLIKEHLNQQLTKAQQSQSTQSQAQNSQSNNTQAQAQQPKLSITSQAKLLHEQILKNATINNPQAMQPDTTQGRTKQVPSQQPTNVAPQSGNATQSAKNVSSASATPQTTQSSVSNNAVTDHKSATNVSASVNNQTIKASSLAKQSSISNNPTKVANDNNNKVNKISLKLNLPKRLLGDMGQTSGSGYWGSAPYSFSDGILTVGSGTITRYGALEKQYPINTSFFEPSQSPLVNGSDSIHQIVFNGTTLPSDCADGNSTKGNPLFPNDGSFSKIVFNHVNTSNITNMSDMLSRNSSLTDVEFGSDFNTSNVTNMNRMFASDTNLSQLNLGANFKLQSPSTMFASDNKLNTINGMWGSTPYTIDRTSKTLAVHGNGTVLPKFHSLSANDPLRQLESDITSVSFQGDVKVGSDSSDLIPNRANVTGLDVSGLDMSDVTNMNNMFSGMTALTCGTNKALNLNFRSEPKDLKSMAHTFSGDGQLQHVNLENLNTSNVSDMSDAFSNMGDLFDVQVGPNFYTSNVTNMNDMFANDTSLTNLNLGNNFNSGSVQTANGMLPSNLQQLTSKWGSSVYTLNLSTHTLSVGSGTISDLHTINQNDPLIQEEPQITNVQFSGNDVRVNGSSSDIIPNRGQITALSTSGLDLSTPVTGDVSGTFEGLSNLTNLDLSSDGYLSSLNKSDMSNMFKGDSSLTNLNLGNLSTTGTNNMSGMFQDLSNLATLNLKNDPNFSTNQVTNMSDMFDSDTSLKNLNLGSNFTTHNVNNANNMMFGVPTNNASDVITGVWGTAPYKLTGNTLTVGNDGLGTPNGAIENFADWAKNNPDNPLVQAANNNRITQINFTGGVRVPSDCSNSDGSFFPDQSSITSIDVSGLNMGNVSNMNGMFSRMTGLTSLSLNMSNLPNQVSTTNNLFNGDSSLKSLDLGNWNTGSDTDMSYMFNGDSSLTNLNLGPNFTTGSVTNMDHMFNGLSDLSSLNLGNYFNTSKVTNMSDMFNGMKTLNSLNLGNSFYTNAPTTDFDSMFSNMSSLRDLNLGTNFNVNNNSSSNILNGDNALQTMEGQWSGAPYTLNLQTGELDVGQGNIDSFGQFSSSYPDNPLVLKQSFVKKINFSNTTAPEDCSAYSSANPGEFFPNQNNVTDINVAGLNMSQSHNLHGMFAYMPNLTNSGSNGTLTLNFSGMPNTATNTAKMFYGDSGLRALHLNNLDTQGDSDMSDMFKNMRTLSDLQVGNSFYTSDANKLSDMFENDSKLHNIHMGSHFITKSNANTKNMFNSSNRIPNSDTITGVWDSAPYTLNNGTLTVGSDGQGDPAGSIDNFNQWAKDHPSAPLVEAADNKQIHKIIFKNGVKAPSDSSAYNINANQNEFFPDQSTISDINVSGLDMSNVTNMHGMFAYMSDLTNRDSNGTLSLNFSRMPANVKDTSFLFYGDNGLKTINLNNLDTSNDTDMNHMFNGASGVQSLALGNNFNTSNVNNMDDMFRGMTGLSKLDLGTKFDTSNVKSMNDMFNDMTNLSDLNLGTHFNARTGVPANNLLNNQPKLKTMEGQWNGAPYKLTFSNGELDVGQGTVDNFTTFAKTYANNPLVLKEANVHKINFKGTTAPSDSSAFDNNDNSGEFLPNQVNVSDLNASDLDTSNVTNMNGMFSGMTKLTNSDWGHTLQLGTKHNTSNVTDMHNMFNNDNALQNLTLGNEFDTHKVTDMSGMFNNMAAVKNLYLNNDANFDTSDVTNMSSMFNGMSSVQNLNLGSNFDTRNVSANGVSNMDNMFNGLNSLQNLNLGTKFNTNSSTSYNNFLGQDTYNYGYKTDPNNNKNKIKYLMSITRGLLPNTATIEGQWNNVPYTLNLKTGELDMGAGTLDNFGKFAQAHPYNPLVLEAQFVKSVKFNGTKLPADSTAYDWSDNSGEFFPNQNNIVNLDPTGLDMTQATNMHGLFSNMYNLTNSDYKSDLTLKFNMSTNAYNTSDMFQNDFNLHNLKLGSDTDGNNYFNTTKIKHMNNMFNNMSNLQTLDLGTNFRTDVGNIQNNPSDRTSDGSNMLNGLSNLWQVKGMWNHAHYTLTAPVEMSDGKPKHKHLLDSDNGILQVYDGAINKFGDHDQSDPDDPLVQNETRVNQVIFSDVNKPAVVAKSDASAYNDPQNKGNYVFKSDSHDWNDGSSDSFDTNKKTVSDNGPLGNGEFFPNQHNIADLKVSGLDTSHVTNMNGMFSGMVNVSNQDLPGSDHDTLVVGNGKFNTANVTDMGNLFNESGGTAAMILPNIKFDSGFNTSKVTNMHDMFNGNSKTWYNWSWGNSSDWNNQQSNGNGLAGTQWNVNSIDFSDDPNFTTKSATNLHQMFQHLYFVNSNHTNSEMSGHNNLVVPDSRPGTQTLNFSHNDLSISPQLTSLSDMFSDLSDIDTINLSGTKGQSNTGFNSTNQANNGGVTSSVTDMNHMFNDLYGLSHLKLGNNFDTSAVNNMSYMFNGFRNSVGNGTYTTNDGLTNLFLGPKFKTDNVTDMSGMFYSDINTSVQNSNYNSNDPQQSDKSAGGIYFGNQFNTENVWNMSDMFHNDALASLDLTKEASDNASDPSDNDKSQSNERANRFLINTRNLTNMAGMFSGMSSMNDLKLDNHFNTSKVTNMSDVFQGCSGLSDIKLDSDFITKQVTNMSRMFSSTDFKHLYFDKNFDVGNVSDMSDMFQFGSHSDVNLNLSVKSDSDNGDNTLCLNPKGKTSLTNVNGMFSYENFNSVNLKNVKTAPGLHSTNSMFNDTTVHNLNLDGFDTHNVSDMSNMFNHAFIGNLNQELPLIDTTNLSDMNQMFINLDAPSDLDIYKFRTDLNKKPKNMSYMFDNVNLKRINFGDPYHHNGDFDTSCTTNMSDMFRSDTIPQLNVSDISTKSVTNMNGMLSHMNVTGSIDLPSTDPKSPEYYKNGHNEFYQSDTQPATARYMFEGINIPKLDVSGINTKNVTDMGYMFNGANVQTPINFGKETNSFVDSPNSSQFSTQNVTNMSDMFNNVYQGDSTPQKLDLSVFNTGKVQNMANMFNGANVFHNPTTDSDRGRLNLGNQFDTSQVRNIGGMFANLPVKTIGFSPLDDINLGNDFKLANCKAYGADTWTGDDQGDDPDNSWNWSINGSSNGMFANDPNLAKVDLSHLWPGLGGTGLVNGDDSLSDINLHDFYLHGSGVPYEKYTKSVGGNNGRGYHNYTVSGPNQDIATMKKSDGTPYTDSDPNPYKNYDALKANTENAPLLTLDLNKNDTFKRDNGEAPGHQNFFSNKYNSDSDYYSDDITHNPAMGPVMNGKGQEVFSDISNGTKYTEVPSSNKDSNGKPIMVYQSDNGTQKPLSDSDIQPELQMDGDPSQFYSTPDYTKPDGTQIVHWHHYDNFTDGYWYHVDNQGHLSQPTNLQDDKKRDGTWFRNKGINVIVYVDQNGHNTVVNANAPLPGETSSDFQKYIINNHPGLPFGNWIPDPNTDIVIKQGDNPNNAPGVPTEYIGLVHIFGEPTTGSVMIPARFYKVPDGHTNSDITISKINSESDHDLDHTGVVPMYYSGFIGGTYSDASVNNLIDHKNFNSDGGYIAKAVIVRQKDGSWIDAKGNSIGNIIPASSSRNNTQNFPSALVWEKGQEPTAIYVYHKIFKHREHQERIPYQFVLSDGNPVNIGDKQQYITVDNKDSFHYGTRGIPLPPAPDGYSIYRGTEHNTFDPVSGKTYPHKDEYNLYDEQHLSDKVVNIDRHNTPQPSTGQTNEILIPIIGDVEEASGPVTYKLIYDGAPNNYAGHLPQYTKGIVNLKGKLSTKNHRVGTLVNFNISDATPGTITNFQRTPSDNYTGEAYLEPHDTFSWIETGLWDNDPLSDNGQPAKSDMVMGQMIGRPRFDFHAQAAQINYQYGNTKVATKYVVFPSNPNNEETIDPDQLTVPKGYHVVSPASQSQITIHASQPNVIMVVPNKVQAIGEWGDAFYTLYTDGTLRISQNNSNFPATVNSIPTTVKKLVMTPKMMTDPKTHKQTELMQIDPKTKKPTSNPVMVPTVESDPVTMNFTNDGKMMTNQWPTTVLYDSSDVNSNGSDNVVMQSDGYAKVNGKIPYALNKSDVKHIEFEGHIILPSDASNIFDNLPNLESFDGTNADTSNVKNMSAMFQNDPKLAKADMGQSGVAQLTNASQMFSSDSALNNVDLTGWHNSRLLTNTSNMFYSDAALDGKGIHGISDLNVGSLSDVHGMFAHDKSLIYLNLGDKDSDNPKDVNQPKPKISDPYTVPMNNPYGQALENMQSMFSDDPKLSYLDLSQFLPTDHVDAANAFAGDFNGSDLHSHAYQIVMDPNVMQFNSDSKLDGDWTHTPVGSYSKSPQLDQFNKRSNYSENFDGKVHTWQKVEPASITIRYIDAAGNIVYTGILGDTYLGAPSTPLPTTDSQAYATGLSHNYTLNAGQANAYGVSSDNAHGKTNYYGPTNPTVDLYVTGRELNQNLPIKIVYENSDGSQSGTPDVTGQPAAVNTNVSLDYPYDGPYSDTFHYSPSDVDHLAGYTLDSDATGNSNFQVDVANNKLVWNHGTPTVYFKADPSSNNLVTINQVVESPNGAVLHSTPVQVPIQSLVANGTVGVGHTYTIKPSDVNAPADSKLASDNQPNGKKNQPMNVTVLNYSNGQANVEQSNDNTLYYVRSDNDAISQINVNYINQNGSKVGFSQPTGVKGSVLNLKSLPVPVAGYSYDANHNNNASDMTFGSTTQTANVYVVGKSENVPVNYTYDGTVLKSIKLTPNKNHKLLVGSDVIIPTNQGIDIPNGYALKPGTVTKETITYQPGSDMTPYDVPLVANNMVVPVKFYDINHANQQVGPMNDSVQGQIDETVELPKAPKGYNYKYPSDQSYKFSDKNINSTNVSNMNSDNVPVYGDNAQVTVHYVDQNGQPADNGNGDYTINKVMGDTVALNNAPKGYTVDASRVNGFTDNSGALSYTFDPSDIASQNNNGDVMRDIVIRVSGNQILTEPVNVYVQKENDKGKLVGTAQSDQINMNNVYVGDQYTFDPKTVVPANYQLDQRSGRTPLDYRLKIDSDGNAQWLTSNGKAVVYVKDNAGVAGTVKITKVLELPNGQIVNVIAPNSTDNKPVPVSGSLDDRYDLNYKNYNNVPNYHLAGPTELKDGDGKYNQDITGYVTDQGLTNDHAVLYYIANPASDVNVRYVVTGSKSTDKDLADVMHGNGKAYYGEQGSGMDTIPSGYLFDRSNPNNFANGQPKTFTYGIDKSAVIYVQPNKAADHSLSIKLQYEDPYGDLLDNNVLHLPSSINVPVSEGQFSIDPNNNVALKFITDHGFNCPTEAPITGTLKGSDFDFSAPSDNTDNDTFVYEADRKNAGTIAVQFINQNGQYVDESGNIDSLADYPKYYASSSDTNGAYRGNLVENVVNNATGGNYPDGYEYMGGRQSYIFDGTDQIAKIMVKGADQQDTVHINLIENDPNGKYLRTVSVQQPVNVVVGNTYTFNSDDYQPDGFSDMNYAHPKITSLVAEPDNMLSNNGTVTFAYKMSATNQNLKPVTVYYENDNNHQVIAQSDINPSAVNKAYDGIQISDVTKYAVVPKAYTLDNDQNKQAVMTQNPSSVTLMVHPTSSTGKGNNNSDVAQPILLTYLDSANLNKAVPGSSNLPIEGYTGQQINVLDPYGVPAGYKLDSDQTINYQISNKVTHAYLYVRPASASSVPYHLIVKIIDPKAATADHPLSSNVYTKVIPISDSLTVDPTSRTNPIDGSQLPSASDYMLSDTLSSITNKTTFVNNNGTLTPNPDSQDTLVYRAKSNPNNLGKLTVQYYDGDRQLPVSNNVISQGYVGKQFKPSDLTNLVPVPQGYQINSDEIGTGAKAVDYTMNTSDQVIKLYVHGSQPVRALSHITLYEYDPYNNKLINSQVVSDVINGNVGGSYEIDPQDFVPSGYQLDNPKYQSDNHVYKGVLSTKGVSDGSKNIKFYYQLPASDGQLIKPITVNYVDNGYPVASKKIGVKPNVDYVGEMIPNVTAPNEAGLPAGYQVSPTDQNLSATFKHTSQTVTVNVNTTTVKSSGTFFVVYHLYSKDKNGQYTKLTQTGASAVPMTGVIGGPSQTISDGSIEVPAGYHAAAGQPSVKVGFTPSGLSKSTVSYDYDSDPVQPIHTQYFYKGAQVDPEKDVTITKDAQGNALTMNELVDVAQNIPDGYQLVSSGNPSVLQTAKANAQTFKFNIAPVPDTSKTFNLTIVRKDPSGKVISSLPKLTIPVRITANPGQSQNVSTANLSSFIAPDAQQILAKQLNGFKPTNDLGSDVTVTNGKSKLTPSSDTFYYTADQNVQPINVVYYNQHGKFVMSDEINSGYMDEPVSDVTKNVPVPAGYQLIPNFPQQKTYVFGSKPQTANLMVIGDAKINPVNVDIYENGKLNRTVSDYVHGNVGDSAIVDANNFIPQGYKLTPGHNAEIPVIINDNGVTPTSVQFYYSADPAAQAQPIYVTYVNQSGTKVVDQQQIVGSRVYGQSVDVYKATKRALDDGAGHQVYTLDDPNADYTYTYGGNAQYVTIQVTGVSTQNTYTVNQIMKGNGATSPITKVVNGRVGDKLTLNPYDYQPSGYSVDSTDTDHQITLVPEEINNGQAQSSPVNYVYDASSSVDHLLYENASDDNAVIKEQDLTGKSGDQISYGSTGVVSYSDGGSKHQFNLPDGFEFVSYGDKNAQIGNHNDVVYVKRIPVATQYGSIAINYVDVSGKTAKSIPNSSDYEYGVAGQPFDLAKIENSVIPNGYTFKYLQSSPVYSFNNAQQTVTIGVVPQGDSYSTITVNYMYNGTLVNSEKVSGKIGNHFDPAPYIEDLPEGYGLQSIDFSSIPNTFGLKDKSFDIQLYE